MKHLVGKQITESVEFLGDTVEVKKLSVSEVMGIQRLFNKSQKSKAEDSQIQLLRDVIRIAVVDAEELTDEDFDSFPLGELNKLSEDILRISGLSGPEVGN